jgi:hypothetical protein
MVPASGIGVGQDESQNYARPPAWDTCQWGGGGGVIAGEHALGPQLLPLNKSPPSQSELGITSNRVPM